ncbi:cell wall hydrolase [Alphaproteobacteria bacterium]|nr:cell wall hydrolase [Alphaproteobacteria bacterium]
MRRTYTNTLRPQKSFFKETSSKKRYFWIISLFGIIGISSVTTLKKIASQPNEISFTEPGVQLLTTTKLKEHLRNLEPSKRKDIDLIARTVFGEARGENSFQALQAIAHVILNRVKDGKNWPSSVRDVILQNKQFSCWNQRDPNYYKIQSVTFNNTAFRQAYQATLSALSSNTDITNGANHYHANWVAPRWSRRKNMIRVAHINKHVFYKA